MNLLSVAAASAWSRRSLQWGWLAGLIAVSRTGSIDAFLPVLVFAILVFGAFVLGGEHIIKLFGIGLAAGVLMDALIVRSVLVPGLMLAVGKANWALPRALDRLFPTSTWKAKERTRHRRGPRLRRWRSGPTRPPGPPDASRPVQRRGRRWTGGCGGFESRRSFCDPRGGRATNRPGLVLLPRRDRWYAA